MKQMQNFIEKANRYGRERKPFLFLIDFELKKPFIIPIDKIAEKELWYDIKGNSNLLKKERQLIKPVMNLSPIAFSQYNTAFSIVQKHINNGDSYLLNLTFPTSLETDFELKDFYLNSKAAYKLYFKDQFTLFSPESFVKTSDNFIYSYPMKGTIDADIPDAEEKILTSKKEEWEHNTIVDLIRNDLSIISSQVEVSRFRYISTIKTNKRNLLQVSSEVKGKLSQNWQDEIGDLLNKLLPAGSISGAPKKKTVEIISKAEKKERGYFTGIFGVFDGENIDSAVNIRFVEKNKEGLQFRSGGGITANSEAESEYNELIDKVYVPIS